MVKNFGYIRNSIHPKEPLKQTAESINRPLKQTAIIELLILDQSARLNSSALYSRDTNIHTQDNALNKKKTLTTTNNHAKHFFNSCGDKI